VYWQDAPDHRTSLTLDWMNDACEARIAKRDRDCRNGKVTYEALMSPISVTFIFPGTGTGTGTGTQFDLMRANLSDLPWGKRKYIEKFPISLLLTAMLGDNAVDETTNRVQYVLVGTKKRLGRRAEVRRYGRTTISCAAAESADDIFRCLLRHATSGDIEIRFSTKAEADFLRDWLPQP
jgi:hypothetical protein